MKDLDKTAGLDPALEQVRLEALKRQQDEERKLERRQDRMEQLRHLGDMLAKLEQKKQQDEANRKAQEEMKRRPKSASSIFKRRGEGTVSPGQESGRAGERRSATDAG